MSVTVSIPTPLRSFTGGRDAVAVVGATVGQVLDAGQEIVGYYHSHPDHPARPSAFDAEHAWPWYSYLIVRIDRGRGADMASWVLDDERPLMHPESLDVLSEV